MKNVLLVFGGVSYEHDISVVTAMQIYKKSRLENINLILLYISRDERFFVCNGKKIKLSDFSLNNFDSKNKKFKEVCFVSSEKKKLFAKTRFGLKECACVDAAIFACHGGDGENGRLVAYFEKQGIPCSAGSSNALAVCMDKGLFKSAMRGVRVPVVSGFTVSVTDYMKDKNCIDNYLKFYKFPLVIKSNSGGSSIGVFVVNSIEEFHEKILVAFEFDEKVVVEKFIKNSREFNVAIVGDECGYSISEIDEPIKADEILSFSDKYLSGNGKSGKQKGSMGNSLKRFPADISEYLAENIKKISEKIFKALGLYGVVRFDFLYDTKLGKLYICEVNAIPGSLAYYFYKKNRIITNDLIEKLVCIAENNKDKNKLEKQYITNILD